VEGWAVAAALFAAGALALGLLDEWRRWRSRPSWDWSAYVAVHQRHTDRYRVTLQLIADHPAYHVTVHGDGLELDHDHHDHDHDRTDWPHLGMMSPSDAELVLYVMEDGSGVAPQLRVTWAVPPIRRDRHFEQVIPVDPDAELGPEPYELRGPRWWEGEWWRRRWQAVRDGLSRSRSDAPSR
jgi:hypothetical protein